MNRRVRFPLPFFLWPVLALLSQLHEFPVLQGRYLGQKPPGRIPELFAPEVFNPTQFAWYHSTIVFSPDGQEALWSGGRPKGSAAGEPERGLFMTRRIHDQWSGPRLFPFLGGDGDSPAISPDGKKLYFLSTRPIPGMEGRKRKENIWVSERIGSEWSEPQPLPQAINALEMHWQISVDRFGNLYFGVWKVDPATDRTLEHDIHVSRFPKGRFQAPERLGPEINGPDTRQFSPHVSPEGDYLLFSRTTKNAPFRTTIHISFLGRDGRWMPPLDLSDTLKINGGNARLTPDGKYMFFLKSGLEIYWMDAGFIEEMRPKEERKGASR
jgi:WD40-like Beta Propeller Repeat